jgi:hypothetical protein
MSLHRGHQKARLLQEEPAQKAPVTPFQPRLGWFGVHVVSLLSLVYCSIYLREDRSVE